MVLSFFVKASKICIEIETYCTYLHFSFTILKYKISYSSQKSLTLKRNSLVVTQDLFIVKTDSYNNCGLKYLMSNVKVSKANYGLLNSPKKHSFLGELWRP